MTTTGLAALDRRFRKLDAAYDAAVTSRDQGAVPEAFRLSQTAFMDLYNAIPQTLQDVGIVLKRAAAGIDITDPLAGDLLPRLRRLRIRIGRQRAAGLSEIVELRNIARAAEGVCDGGGETPWISQWLRECVACLSRPRLV